MTVVSSYRYVTAGMIDNGDIVLAGGQLFVSASGTINNTTINASSTSSGFVNPGTVTVYSGGVASGTKVSGTEFVLGLESGGTVSTGGVLQVDAGGMAVNVTLSGTGITTSTTPPPVSTTGLMTLYGAASGTVINGGLQLDLGTATSTTINSGGEQYIYNGGVAISTTVNSGGEQLLAGATASATTVNSGGLQYVSWGNVASQTTLNGGTQIDLGIASGTIIASSGSQIVSGQGVANSTSVGSGGSLYVESAGVAGATLVSGGTEYVRSAGNAFTATIGAGGNQIVSTGGYAGGELAGGVQGGTTINNGGTQTLSGGTALHTTVNSGGQEVVFAGATTSNTIVNSGGAEFVSSGGVAAATTINGGTLELGIGASAGSRPITFGAASGGTLRIDGTAMPTNVIDGLAWGDIIDFAGVPFDGGDAFAPGGAYTLFDRSNDAVAGNTNNGLDLVEGDASFHLNFDPLQTFNGGFIISDDRHGGTQVQYTSAFVAGYSTSPRPTDVVPPDPYGAVCLINGNSTGFIIGPHTIITAAHNVWDETTSAVRPNITVTDARGIPIGDAFSVLSVHVSTGWETAGSHDPTNFAEEQSDFAVINTSDDLSQYGRFRLDAGYGGGTINVTGYPDAGGGRQFSTITTGKVDTNFNGVIDYSTNGYPGMSGGPLWVYNGASAYAVGLTFGGGPTAASSGYGVRFTTADLAQIDDLRRLDPALIEERPDLFTGDRTSDILFRNNATGDAGFYQMNNGANAGWVDIGPSSTAYALIAAGDFNGDGTTDLLFRNGASGDTGFYRISNGANAGWVDIGASSTAYNVVGLGDFRGTGTDDVLFRNNATGDTGFYQLINGVNAGWHHVGSSSTAYSVVGVGDFNGDATSDILFRNNATGDTGFYQMSNGANAGWHDIGPSSTAYSVVGVGDFNGDGSSDILFRNAATGDTGFYQIVNGANTGWHSVGASSTAYNVVGTGDYNGDGTSDILFRDNTTGDTGFYAMVNGVNTGWHNVGASATAYHVVR